MIRRAVIYMFPFEERRNLMKWTAMATLASWYAWGIHVMWPI